MGSLWHPFAQMGAVERDGAFVVARGEGSHVFDAEGRRYLDATAALWYANVGHGRTEIAEAVADQMSRIAAYTGFGDFATDVTEQLAERLAGIAPVPGSKIFFTSGGSDSIETAAKLARRYWAEIGQPGRHTIIGRQKAYHGSHWAGTALGGIPPNQEGLGGPLLPDVAHVSWDDPESLRGTIEQVGAENVAAFFCEPVIGAGGVYPPPEDYLLRARKICAELDVLFIADEVITGYGRIGGSWFASTRFGLEPDLITTAKGLTSGYLPMGAVLVAPRVAEPFFTGQAWFRHGYTYSGHAASAAAGLANLAIIERENLLESALGLEAKLMQRLAPIGELDAVAEIRGGVGALASVQLADPATAAAVSRELRDAGVIARPIGVGALQISPPLIFTDDDLDELVAGLQTVLG
ncbi:adenosylmethionine-8-amino-7-oxononanoate aminotransferase [Naumannella cuiyingiana]|uniref:Adenosylmethionine-8-amino-7-oxononanoate aminotransferase n=1 Tax=Naumannella cuiyingiana TaxID=1347891 RepID=A0A7Z0IKB2_9ACTN|nr:aminotransferase class III-fold pyridoxal phosphate-dependent enzyme [Naumannella cuiyingiana]NYI70429.1 adenosylmethionine-8-amino-7-oxononanoate aminotransferase [Naumannella cuiyingiana]